MTVEKIRKVFSLQLLFLVSVMVVFYAVDVLAGEDGNVKLDKVQAQQWQALSTKRIFFGHQSVGYNILDGIKMWEEENPAINLQIVKITSPDEFDAKARGVIFHGDMGINSQPESKIDNFSQWFHDGLGGKADIAFLKLCFVDVGTRTDVESLFSYYKEKMAQLKKKYPATIFVHLTVPLVTEQTGTALWKHKLKGVIKKIIGKNEVYENIDKLTFNNLLRAEYSGRAPFFDLAKVESTYPDGTRSVFSFKGKQIESLIPEYSSDGGHLSAKGKKVVAEKLLLFLANLQ